MYKVLFIAPNVHKIAIWFTQSITTQYITILHKSVVQHNAEQSYNST